MTILGVVDTCPYCGSKDIGRTTGIVTYYCRKCGRTIYNLGTKYIGG